MSLPESSQGDRAIFFDDEPIESVLYAERRAGPSNASLFAEAFTEAKGIAEDLADGKTRAGISCMVRLLESDQAVPLSACHIFVLALKDLIPECPRPLLPEGSGECGAALRGLISRADRYRADAISSPAGVLLYRWHEGRGEYAEARSVIHPMMIRAEREGSLRQAGTLVNNYGYEYLMEGRPAEAIPYFEQAVERFTRLKNGFEIANAGANILTCRFALSAPRHWNVLVQDLVDTHRTLHRSRDWRTRKTLRLLAELAAERGRLAAAKRWARLAVAASWGVSTHLREEDEQFLKGLETAGG